VSSQQQQQQQQQQQEQQQEQQHIVTARGFQSIEELQKLQEEIERVSVRRREALL
jgi:predicted transcriptional regulator